MLGDRGMAVGPSQSLMQRFERVQMPDELRTGLAQLERGEFGGDVDQLVAQFALTMSQFQRGIDTSMSAFPVRENLEAEAKILVPADTPFRNRLKRTPGAGTSSAWKIVTSLGGGWATSLDQPGSPAVKRSFFGERGSPDTFTTVYGNRTAAYKLLGQEGDVTGFAMATGRNFQDQYATERNNALINTMLNEENALINGDSTSALAPWGDGTNALAFDGIINQITTANGTPSAQVQTSVGALTFAHIDGQLNRIWKQGGRNMYILMNMQETQSIQNLAEASGTMHRIVVGENNRTLAGLYVGGYVHQMSQEVVPFITDRFMPAGTMIFGCDTLPDGSPAADVQVLPQVELPQLAPNESIQGYVVQEIPPSRDQPQVFAFLISVYEVLRVKSFVHFAKSTGVTAV